MTRTSMVLLIGLMLLGVSNIEAQVNLENEPINKWY